VANVEKFSTSSLEAIARILGEPVTGTQLTYCFKALQIADTSQESTKWKRIFHSLAARQTQDGCGNNVIVFIKEIMSPVRFENTEQYENTRVELNKKLLFSGYEVKTTGEIARVESAKTISEAEERASSLRRKLSDRAIHSEVLKYCKAELLEQNYFHCVFEATKGLSQRIRDMTGLAGDAAKIAEEAFSVQNPLLALNSLRTDTEQSDQKGFANLLKGIFGTFRNVRAHQPRIHWAVDEKEVLDALTMISYSHRRIDEAVVVKRVQ
jgi:uncharacterized protein (TIGR02391 family)